MGGDKETDQHRDRATGRNLMYRSNGVDGGVNSSEWTAVRPAGNVRHGIQLLIKERAWLHELEVNSTYMA